MYSILAINPGHNGSVALVVDGNIAYYAEEERLTRSKYDGNPFRGMIQILSTHPVDELVIGGTSQQLPQLPWTAEDPYTALARKFNPNIKVTNLGNLHHLGHASAAFYGSGFDSAAAIIVDGAGSFHQEQVNEQGQTIGGFETETIYHCSYPNQFNAIYKRYSDGGHGYFDNGIQEFDGSVTLTKAYEAVSHYLGFGFIEAGKTMGLAPYGSPDDSIPKFFLNGKGNRNLLIPQYPAGAFIDENRFPNLKRFVEPREWHNDFSLIRDIDKNIAWEIQDAAEEYMFNLIQKAIDTTGETNIVLSGGFALNCVANYKLLKQFPDINFYVDPIAHDGGTAIGLALFAWHQHDQENNQVNPLKSVYLGMRPDYGQLDQVEQYIDTIATDDSTVAQLIAEGKVVALFQGSAEGGPRALGNRSILFDPRRPDGKDIVNRVKRREWFRPFAGSVMVEHANRWFDMANLAESPFMMYAVDVWPEVADKIPAVTHVDQTCRVQTVSQENNENYYNLINEFYKLTDVPILFNTSFNLAGQPLVETVIDAVVTLINSEIDFLYLPEIGKLVAKKQA